MAKNDPISSTGKNPNTLQNHNACMPEIRVSPLSFEFIPWVFWSVSCNLNEGIFWKNKAKRLAKQLLSDAINALACLHCFHCWQNQTALKTNNNNSYSGLLNYFSLGKAVKIQIFWNVPKVWIWAWVFCLEFWVFPLWVFSRWLNNRSILNVETSKMASPISQTVTP